MNGEYVIINKAVIEKRMEELNVKSITANETLNSIICFNKCEELEQILSQSTPLILELEKAILEGRNSIHFENDGSYWEDENVVEDYISNLKLDI